MCARNFQTIFGFRGKAIALSGFSGPLHGLFVELVLEENPDPDVPGAVIVHAHEQKR